MIGRPYMSSKSERSFKPWLLAIGFFLSTFSLYPQCACEWEWQHPLPQGNDLENVRSFGPDTVLALGSEEGVFFDAWGSNFLRSYDGGDTWEHTACDRAMNGFHFQDPSTGWSVGSNGTVLHTNDGGRTWRTQETPVSVELRDVHFIDASTGWAVGAYGKVLFTEDGGDHWTLLNETVGSSLYSVHFVDDSRGWAMGRVSSSTGIVHYTSDGGVTWTDQFHKNTIPFLDLHIVDGSTGWVSGQDGMLFHTEDGGGTWQTQEITPTFDAPVHSVHFADASHGWVAAGGGFWDPKIFYTNNGGDDWIEAKDGDLNGYFAVCSSSPQGAWVAGEDGVLLRTTDTGSNWKEARQKWTPSSLKDVAFLDHERGWIGGTGAALFYTNDGGQTWTDRSPSVIPGNYQISAIEPLGDSKLWAVSYEKILFSSDGGSSWYVLDSASSNLEDLQFRGSSRGWAVGQNGLILRTFDAGNTWQQASSSVSENLRAVHFPTDQTGWAVGSNGVILRSLDGGQTWQQQPSGTSSYLKGVHFLNDEEGWVVGNDGVILHTENGGDDWSTQASGTSEALHSVEVDGSGIGFITGRYGLLYRTDNGGKDWELSYSGAFKRLSALELVDSTRAWTVGGKGTVLAFSSDEKERRGRALSDNAFQLFPNPSRGKMHLRFEAPLKDPVKLEVYDSRGRSVREERLNPVGSGQEFTFHYPSLSQGLYFVSLRENGSRKDVKKWLLEE